ncbi:uncharacterized protein N7484_011369 [Penicillium longicatenatum]|uniref:uncharacterized protein n=1 Tax=Penicillium longicatenatum TaxID=1561947 RepID=UPI0025477070|nr:uncharacterized protein N7484_011369 [Penicillium longicatenatum]KAJ5631269.1 hypothetical protein N7484_011369 [Penicillium longicatenatum]
MTISHYGVWACTPTSYEAQTTKEDPKSPHIYLHFTDDSSSSKSLEAAINVKSTDKDTRLVFWLNRNFTHSITEQLSNLDLGFHLTSSPSSSNPSNSSNKTESKHHNNRRHHRHARRDQVATLQGLDFVRTKGLVDIQQGEILGSDGSDASILAQLDPIISDAINKKATAYIFGSSYGSGIHDVHMNQGSLPSYSNGIYEDGALLFKFDDGHWEAVFLAFASQKIPTDDDGESTSDSKSLASILGASE